MKNILIIATYFLPMGGVGTIRVTKYVKYLRKFGWNPIVVTTCERIITNKDKSLLKDIGNDIEIIRLDFEVKDKIGRDFYIALKKNIDSIINVRHIDVVFITGGPFDSYKIGPYIYNKFRIPYIIDMRDPWKLQNISKLSFNLLLKGTINKFFIGMAERKVLYKAGAICTVNETMTQRYVKEYPALKGRFYTIPNGYDEDDYKDIVPHEFAIFTIVYAGKFRTSAGFRDPNSFFKAIRMINNSEVNAKFLHVGTIESEIIEMAKKEGVYEYCDFIGNKSYKETLEYCKGASLLLVIGSGEKSEQTGKIFDCIGCEKPVLLISNGESEIDVISKQIPNIYQIKHVDIEGACNFIYDIKHGKISYKKQQVELYKRENLTRELVQIINKISEGKIDDR